MGRDTNRPENIENIELLGKIHGIEEQLERNNILL